MWTYARDTKANWRSKQVEQQNKWGIIGFKSKIYNKYLWAHTSYDKWFYKLINKRQDESPVQKNSKWIM